MVHASESAAKPPRSLRRILTRVVLFVGVLLTILSGALLLARQIATYSTGRTLQEAKRDLVEQGAIFDQAVLAPPHIPDEQNAALLLEPALQAMRDLGRAFTAAAIARRLTRTPEEEAWDAATGDDGLLVIADNRELIAGYLTHLEPTLAVVEEALRQPGSRYPIAYEDGFAAEFPHLTSLRGLARVYLMRSRFHLSDGNTHDAVEDCLVILRLAKTLHDEPFLVSYLVRIAIDGMAATAVESIILAGTPSTDDLEALEAAFVREAADLHSQFVHVMQGEWAAMFSIWDDFPRFPGAETTQPTFAVIGQWYANINLLRTIEVGQESFEAFDLPYTEAKAKLQVIKHDLEYGSKLYAVVAIVWPSTLGGIDSRARIVALMRVSAASCGARLTMTTLEDDALSQEIASIVAPYVDPYSGNTLQIHLSDSELTIYAVGPNTQDDHGHFEDHNYIGDTTVRDDIALTLQVAMGS